MLILFPPHFKVILVQVNPGEAFTIRREDGQFQCITGKKDNLLLFAAKTKNVLYVIIFMLRVSSFLLQSHKSMH